MIYIYFCKTKTLKNKRKNLFLRFINKYISFLLYLYINLCIYLPRLFIYKYRYFFLRIFSALRPRAQALCTSTCSAPALCTSTCSAPALCTSTCAARVLCLSTCAARVLCLSTCAAPALCPSTCAAPHLAALRPARPPEAYIQTHPRGGGGWMDLRAAGSLASVRTLSELNQKPELTENQMVSNLSGLSKYIYQRT